MNKYLFVIDTADYAGNFECELCAYLTGFVWARGEEYAKMFRKETELKEFFNNIGMEYGEHGEANAEIYPAKGYFNNGYGQHYQDTPENEIIALQDYRKYVEKYYGDLIKQKEKIIELLNGPECEERKRYANINWTISAANREKKDHQKQIDNANKLDKVPKYSSYQSVAIYFNSKPSQEQIKLMKERAYKFAELPKKYSKDGKMISKILGFRLIEVKTVETETIIPV